MQSHLFIRMFTRPHNLRRPQNVRKSKHKKATHIILPLLVVAHFYSFVALRADKIKHLMTARPLNCVQIFGTARYSLILSITGCGDGCVAHNWRHHSTIRRMVARCSNEALCLPAATFHTTPTACVCVCVLCNHSPSSSASPYQKQRNKRSEYQMQSPGIARNSMLNREKPIALTKKNELIRKFAI